MTLSDFIEELNIAIQQDGHDIYCNAFTAEIVKRCLIKQNRMSKDIIYRQDAIDALGEKPLAWTESEYELGMQNQWQSDIDALKELPSAQAEPCEDAVSREAVSEWLKQYGQDVLHGKYKFSLMYIWKNLMDLPSAQPEIIRCKDCKHHRYDADGIPYCINVDYGYGWCDDDYCSKAELRGEQDE